MQLLEFPPPKRSPAEPKRPGASENKLHNHSIKAADLLQGLDTIKMYDQAVLQNLIARTCRKYLGEEETRH